MNCAIKSKIFSLSMIIMLLSTAMNYTSSRISFTTMQSLSVAMAIRLIGVYALTLLFFMKKHVYLYGVGVAEEDIKIMAKFNLVPESPIEKLNLKLYMGVLLVATALVAVESELLVATL